MSDGLDRRLTALRQAADLADGRLDAAAVDAARAVVEKAGARLGLGVESTVVALAGPTGAGKSQLFNVLTGTELAAVGRRRPTTSSGQAAVWGEGADALLDWLEIGRRHRLEADGLGGLVLLDLPDFDSVATSHRLEAERIVALADLVLWVVEPQKYADAALHDRYLRPLATHARAMAVVLNQADLLPPADVAAWRADMERLLVDDGVPKLSLAVVSARTGEGVPELRRLLADRVAAHDAAVERLAADLDRAVVPLSAACGGKARGVRREDRERLLAALEDAAGVPTVVRAVGAAHRRRGALAAGWPFVRWVRRLRPDPLKRLRLPESPQPQVRTSMPPPTDVQRAQVASAARRLADGAAEGLPQPWPRLVREAAVASDSRVADRLDRAVAGADLSVSRPRWWRVAGLLQRVLALAVAAGAVWLLGLAVLGWLRIEDVLPVPEVEGIPIPTGLLLGGAAAGIVLAFLARLLTGAGANRRARRASRSLRAQIETVAAELVVDPLERELEAHRALCAALATASG
ncbi:MAG TPA: GTPase [Gaiellaceae bacterium]|nr:GTPase [Gaiellaceae bacterium]